MANALHGRYARWLYHNFTSLFTDPLLMAAKWRGLPYFLRNGVRYRRAARDVPQFALRFGDVHYMSFDRFAPAGTARGHYFFQDLWAARKLYDWGVDRHVDIGSRVDGFVAHVLAFCEVEYVDVRPLEATVPRLTFRRGTLTALPYQDDALPSVSCLHVLEHVGLGRYGDAIDPSGHVRAAREVSRVLQPGARLLLGVPVGHERLCFDAHRIFDPNTVVELFGALRLEEFALVDDRGLELLEDASLEQAKACEYGCGLFVFRKD